jgi:enamine deaminase RidA (YjgF/YER057c/UK114 family)
MATLTRKSSAKAHKPFANYSHVVTAQGASKLVFCAGQVAADPTGKCRRMISVRKQKW